MLSNLFFLHCLIVLLIITKKSILITHIEIIVHILFCFFVLREIDVESDDETLYQSKRSSQIKRDQHSSLPDLTESLNDSNSTNDISQISDQIEPSSSASSVSTSTMLSPISPIPMDSKRKSKTYQCT